MELISILQSVHNNLKKCKPICCLYIYLMYTFCHVCEKEKSGRVWSTSECIAVYLNTCQCQKVVLSRTVKGDG